MRRKAGLTKVLRPEPDGTMCPLTGVVLIVVPGRRTLRCWKSSHLLFVTSTNDQLLNWLYHGKDHNGDQEDDRDLVKPAVPDVAVLIAIMFKIK